MKTKTNALAILSLVVVLFFCTAAYSQQPSFLFEQQCPYEWQYAGIHALEISNAQGETACYFIAASDITKIGYVVGEKDFMKQVASQSAKVLKLSPDGELLGELFLCEEGRNSCIVRLFRDPFDSKSCLALGKIQDSVSGYHKPYLAKFDLNMNLLWFRETDLPESFQETALFGGRSIMDSNGDIVFCSWPAHFSPQGVSKWAYMFYFRFSPEGELLALGKSPILSDLFYSDQGDLFEYDDGSGDYGQTFVGDLEGVTNPSAFFVRMDRDFTDFQTKDLDEIIHLTETEGVMIGGYYAGAFTIGLPDGYKFMGCRGVHYDGWNPSLKEDVIVAMKLDQNDSIVSMSFTPHDNDSARVMAFCHGMDQSEGGAFFLCNGVYDPEAWFYGEIDGLNRFVVTKTDADANIIWRRYYEDYQHVFHPCSVTATKDEGCLAIGRCWTLDQTEAKIFVLKFFADGTLSVPEAETFIRPYMFYPNPAQGQLHLQYSPDVTPKQIELYDLQGRLVQTQSKNLESLNMAGLPAGTYMMRVMLENGKVFSDKVVKE